jgi:hypothetical protein
MYGMSSGVGNDDGTVGQYVEYGTPYEPTGETLRLDTDGYVYDTAASPVDGNPAYAIPYESTTPGFGGEGAHAIAATDSHAVAAVEYEFAMSKVGSNPTYALPYEPTAEQRARSSTAWHDPNAYAVAVAMYESTSPAAPDGGVRTGGWDDSLPRRRLPSDPYADPNGDYAMPDDSGTGGGSGSKTARVGPPRRRLPSDPYANPDKSGGGSDV